MTTNPNRPRIACAVTLSLCLTLCLGRPLFARGWPTITTGPEKILKTPCRVYDSRLDVAPLGKVTLFIRAGSPSNPGQTTNCATDTNAVAATLAVSVFNHSGGGYLKLAPVADPDFYRLPWVSVLYHPGIVASSMVKVALCDGCATHDLIIENVYGSTGVTVDLVSYNLPAE